MPLDKSICFHSLPLLIKTLNQTSDSESHCQSQTGGSFLIKLCQGYVYITYKSVVCAHVYTSVVLTFFKNTASVVQV